MLTVFATTEKVVGKYAKYEEVCCQENSSLLSIVISTHNLPALFAHAVVRTIKFGVMRVKHAS